MKKILASIACAVLGTLALSSSAHAQQKIAVVDVLRVFNEYYKTKDAESTLKDRMASFEKEREDMSADYQKAYDETSKLHDASADKTLSDQARADKQKAFEQKVQDLHNMERKIQEFNQTRQKQFEDQRLRMRAGIVDEITKYIADLGTREKYTFIYDKSGLSSNGVSLLVYVSPDLRDLTDDVIKALNASKPAGSASASAAPAPAATTPAAPAAKP